MKETLEEAAENMWLDPMKNLTSKMSFIAGAKWQAERMYSEEDLRHAFYTDNRKWSNRFQDYIEVDFEEWFEQFKKK